MVSPEILKKIQAIKVKTRQLMNGTLAGGHITKKRGSGFEFDQIRNYSYGDDVRFIDWNSSARSDKLLVRQYLDEKNRTIMLCLDVSASTNFAGTNNVVADVLQQIAAVLVFVAEHEQDNVGLILFSDQIEKVIMPSKGRFHTMQLIETIFSYKPISKKSNIGLLCNYLIEVFTKEALIFMISDFIVDDFQQELQRLVWKREVIAVRCLDRLERKMVPVGYVWSQDPETESIRLLNLSDIKIAQDQDAFIQKQSDHFKKHRVDCLDLQADDKFIETMILFFKQRMMLP